MARSRRKRSSVVLIHVMAAPAGLVMLACVASFGDGEAHGRHRAGHRHRRGTGAMLDVLKARGYRVRRADGARPGDRLRRYRRRSPTCRAAGPTSRTAARYRLERRDDEALFGYAVGPHSWKKFLHPPMLRLWRAERDGDGVARRRRSRRRRRASPSSACAPASSHAIAIQDRVLPRRRRTSTRTTRRGARAPSSSRSTAARPAAPASASRWTPARRSTAGFDLALTELARRTSTASSSRSARDAGARGARRASASRRAGRRTSTPAEAVVARHGRSSMGREMRRRRPEGPAAAQPRASALGRGGRALPDLRQLHDGLPDLLLHHGRGRRPTSPARVPSARGAGIPASPWISPISTAAACARSAEVALPPVDDPQARHLVRPVRHLRLRRLRPLHHLVPGRHRHHRGGARHPRTASRVRERAMDRGH